MKSPWSAPPVRLVGRLTLAATLSVLAPTLLAAQQRVDPIAIGMAKASVATARGLSAIESNVGALGLDRLGARDGEQGVDLDLSVIPFGASAGSTYLSPDDLDFVFGSKNREDFSDADRLRLARLIEEGRLAADAALDLFALRLRIPDVGAIAVRYGHRVRAQMTFPENFRTTVLSGGDVYRGGEVFRDPEIGGEWTRSLGLSVAGAWNRTREAERGETWFAAMGMGFALNYVEGIAHFDVDRHSWARTRSIASAAGEPYRRIEVQGGYTFRTATPYDTGFSPSNAILNPGFIDSKSAAATGWEGTCGLAVVVLRRHPVDQVVTNGDPLNPEERDRSSSIPRDAILLGIQLEGVGTLEWDGRNYRRTFQNIRDTLSERDGPISNDIIYRYEAPLDTIGAFVTQMPALVRVGVGADITSFVPSIPGDLIAEVETAVDLNRAIGGEGGTRVSIGAAWRPTRFVAVYSGLQLGGRVGAAMALGVTLAPIPWLTFDLATSEATTLLDPDRRRVDVAFRGSAHWTF